MFKANYLKFDQIDLFMFDWIDLEFDQGVLEFDRSDLEFDQGDLPTFYLLLAAQDSETNQSLKD